MSPLTHFPVVSIEEVPLPISLVEATTYRPLVLVVGGESVAADALAETLTQHGFAAVTAYDAPDAIETALIMPPELLIADLELPGTTGIELATAVKEVFPDCKAILLSAQNALPQMPELARLDGEPLVVLSKTVRAEDLLARVAETLKLPQNNKGAAALSN